MLKSLLFAAALAVIPTAGFAQTYEWTVKNGYTDVLTGLSVSGAKIENFKPIPASGKRVFKVTLPDGKCEASVIGTFSNGQRLDAGKFDFCKYDTLNVFFS